MEDTEAPLFYRKQLCQLSYMRETLSWLFQNEIFQACQSPIYLLFIPFEFQEEGETHTKNWTTKPKPQPETKKLSKNPNVTTPSPCPF